MCYRNLIAPAPPEVLVCQSARRLAQDKDGLEAVAYLDACGPQEQRTAKSGASGSGN